MSTFFEEVSGGTSIKTGGFVKFTSWPNTWDGLYVFG